MRSMTGFGQASGHCGGREFAVELSAVNRKSLDVQFSLPRSWSAAEQVIAGWLKSVLHRGAIQCSFKFADASAARLRLPPAGELQRFVDESRERASAVGIDFHPNAEWLLRVAEIWSESGECPPWEEVEKEVEPVFRVALEALVASREREGKHLAGDLLARAQKMEEVLAAIVQASADTVPNYQALLMQRLQKLSLDWDPHDERVLREVAIFADRCDISEEITRLTGHLGLLQSYCSAAEPIGRKADFLLQEINRELNTIGSKANHLGIAHLIVEGKNECERIREQVQNIE